MQVSDEKSAGLETISRVSAGEEPSRYVGTRVKRVEDGRLMTGNDHFLDNFKFPRMAYAGFVRSPYAHAKIRAINLSRIKDDDSVVAILTPEEVRQNSEPIPVIWRVPGSRIHEHYALAQGNVLHVGDPVLAVAVTDRSKLEDILEHVEVVYEVLEPVLDALSVDDKPPIHEELGTNTCFTVPITKGDVEKAIDESHV
ncbi:MAG: xanthine dehydrogenase family protein molybdopterin-binding subunit, partial [Nitrososphaerota archaeon]|nr:xanthine dehydrogenase family protein molybdopterin-binding subunit [Nitrososphaerota archaeon]